MTTFNKVSPHEEVVPLDLGAEMHFGTPGQASAIKRTFSFIATNLAFNLLLFSLVLFDSQITSTSVTFLSALFCCCTIPLLLAKESNGRFAILILFMPVYFMFYGFTDLLAMLPEFSTLASAPADHILSDTEVAVLLGLLSLIAGYTLSVRFLPGRVSSHILADYPLKTVVLLGLLLWIVGLWSTWVWQFQFADTRVKPARESSLITLLTLSRMLQPVGSSLLAYAYLKSRSSVILLVGIVCILIELPFGLVCDSKELAMRTGLIFVFSKWLYDGYVPYRWLLIAAIGAITIFPIFQSYRYEVLQTRSTTREKAVDNLSKSLDLTLSSSTLGKQQNWQNGLKKFSERINLKPTMERVIKDTGGRTPYQNGYTISLLGYALIPRFILPEKPDSSVGRLFNRQFKVSLDPDTYVSATHSGELYWNYGWPGLFLGMGTIGVVLGVLSSVATLVSHKSVTRLLLMVSTIYLLCLRFEGGIALQYTLWIRSIILILALHYLFARRKSESYTSNTLVLEH